MGGFPIGGTLVGPMTCWGVKSSHCSCPLVWSEMLELLHGCLYKLGVLFVAVFRIRALLFGFYSRARDFCKLPLRHWAGRE